MKKEIKKKARYNFFYLNINKKKFKKKGRIRRRRN